MNLKRGYLPPVIFMFTIILVVTGLTWVNYRFNIPISSLDEFKNSWAGAHAWLMQGENPYTSITGFNLPFVAMLYFAPLGLLKFSIARAIWLTCIEASLVLQIILGLSFTGWKVKSQSLPVVILVGMVWWYGVRAVFLGQITSLVLMIIYGSYYLIQKKQDVLGGFLLALAISQPETALLIIIFITIWSLAARRFQILVSMFSGLAFLLVLSVIILPDWPLDWLRILIGVPGLPILYTSIISIAASLIPGISLGLSIILNVSALIFLIIEWIFSLKDAEGMFVWLALITIIVNTLVKFKSDAIDILGILPAFFYIFMVIQRKWKIIGEWVANITLGSLVVFPWLSNLILYFQGGKETMVLNLILLFLCLVLLVWIKWWIPRSQRLPVDILLDRLN